jgi:hypothetical protein
VGFANLAIANNTVSLLRVRLQEINDEYSLSPKKTAAILDIFPVLFRSFAYGASVLILSFAKRGN